MNNFVDVTFDFFGLCARRTPWWVIRPLLITSITCVCVWCVCVFLTEHLLEILGNLGDDVNESKSHLVFICQHFGGAGIFGMALTVCLWHGTCQQSLLITFWALFGRLSLRVAMLECSPCAGCKWCNDRISYDFDWFDIRYHIMIYIDLWYQLSSCCIFILISYCPPCKCYNTWYDKSRCKKRLMILPPFPIRCGTLAGSIKHQEQKQELMAEVFQQDQTGRF